jgi:hypothetical protein
MKTFKKITLLFHVNFLIVFSTQAQSLYIKNGTTCGLDILLRGHDATLYSTPCNLSSSVFSIPGMSTLTINDLGDLNCSFCLPASWIIPSGAPWTGFTTGAFSGAGFDAGYVRTSGCLPVPCSFATVGPVCGAPSTLSLPGCPSATIQWIYISVNDSYELSIF